MIALLVMAMLAGAQVEDRTAIALERCMACPSTAPRPVPEEDTESQPPPEDAVTADVPPDGRTACYDAARRSYDRRIVKAYRSLLRRAQPGAAEWLAQANQAWITYRASTDSPASMAEAARDHALWVERLTDRKAGPE